MKGVAGVEIKAALKKASAWGTPVGCGANDGILIRPSTIKKSANVLVDDSLGTYFPNDGLLGEIKVEGDLPVYLRYDGLDVALAMVMGASGSPAQQGTTAAYAYTYKPAINTDGKFCTLAKYMKNYIEEHPSIKIIGFNIKGEFGKPLTLTLKCVSINKVIDSVINTVATFANVTYTESANRIKFSEGVFRMNAQSGIALAAGDRIYPSSFELDFQRKLTGEYTGQYRTTSGSNTQDLIDEPQNDGLPVITLKLEFPRLTGATNIAILNGDTRQKMDITFTGAQIAAPYNRQFALQFPHLQLITDDPADAAGIIKEPLEFKVYSCTAAPAGMTGITDPLWITGINQRSTDPLS